MASSGSFAGKCKRHAVQEDCPAFCLRIFSREDLKHGKKELPPAAVREYGHQMSDHIYLKVPNCGEHWKIELRTSPRRDRMWLEKGWEEFASFYLLDQGDMSTLISEGEGSHFQVRIYSWDDMEIEYPIRSGGADVGTPEVEEIVTEAVAIATSVSPRSSPAVCGGMIGTEAPALAISDAPRSSPAVCGGMIGIEALAQAISDPPRSSPAVRGGDKVRRRRRRRTLSEAEARCISISPRSSAEEHEYDTFQMSNFRSDKPFLDIRIPAKTLAFRVFINQAFAAEHFYKSDTCCDVTLQNIQGDKVWTIQCCSYKRSNGRVQAIVSGAGWKAFRQENHLDEGDICVLEMIGERKCRVTMFRAKK